jgi:glycosyltransferase involved in cell wall biosynthesis
MKNSNPLLSIIVPMYNSEKTISQCIDSILNQDIDDFELILVDNASLDNTLRICEDYSKEDKRITIIPLSYNGGANAARKAGVRAAKAELIGFVDSDDWIESSMYGTLINIQKENQCDLVSSGMYRDDEICGFHIELLDNFEQGIYSNLPENIYKTMLFDDKNNDFGIYGTLCNKLFIRKILLSIYDEIDMRVFYGEDCLVLYSYIMKISSIYILRKSFYHYNIHVNSVCTTADEKLSINTYYLYKGLEKVFISSGKHKYVLLRQLKKYILNIELHTIEQLYGISRFTLGTYKYNYQTLENKNVIIYGAGNSSESLYKYLTNKCHCKIAAWVDKYPEGKNIKVLHDVISIECISTIKYDYIVIAALKESLADSIRNELINLYDIDEEKIIWNKVEYYSLLNKL